MRKKLVMYAAFTMIVASSVNALPVVDEYDEVEEQREQQLLMIPILNPETGEVEYKLCPQAPQCPDEPPSITLEKN